MKKILISLLFFCITIEAMNSKTLADTQRELIKVISKKANQYSEKYNLEELQKNMQDTQIKLNTAQEQIKELESKIFDDFEIKEQYKNLVQQEEELKITRAGIEMAIKVKKQDMPPQ